MKKYLQKIKEKSPHQRRGHAMQIATAAVVLVFVVWVTTLGVRLTSSGGGATAEHNDTQQTQLAGVASGLPAQADAYAPSGSGGNSLEVATTSTDAFGTQ